MEGESVVATSNGTYYDQSILFIFILIRVGIYFSLQNKSDFKSQINKRIIKNN